MITTIAIICTLWQGIRTCQDEHGYLSHESTWQGMTNGSDNEGNTWSTHRWNGQTIIEEKHDDR